MQNYKLTDLRLLPRRYSWSWNRTAWPVKAIMWTLSMLPAAILALWVTGLLVPGVPW